MTEFKRYDPSHEEVAEAIRLYLEKGGKIYNDHEHAREQIKTEIREQLLSDKLKHGQ